MGLRARLARKLGLLSAAALVVSNMIGTGISPAPVSSRPNSAPPNSSCSSTASADCARSSAPCVTPNWASTSALRGEYVYLTEAFGPVWGFMTGWASFFAGFSAPIAAAALAFAEYAGHFAPLTTATRILIACTLVAVFSTLNILGVERTAKVQNALTIIKVAVLLAFIVIGSLSAPATPLTSRNRPRAIRRFPCPRNLR
ncbi:MAG: amino acid permease [Acidobacteriota bacterium]